MREREKALQEVKLNRIILIFFSLVLVLSSSCANFKPQAEKEDRILRKQWVRKVSAEAKSLRNKTPQNFKPYTLSNVLIQGSSYGGIQGLSKKTGRVLWKFSDKEGVSSSAAFKNGILYFGSYSGVVRAVYIKEKKEVWRKELDSPPVALSKVIGKNIYVLSDKGTLYAISSEDGTIQWNVRGASVKELQVFGGATPHIYRDSVIAAFPDGTVRALERTTGSELWKVAFNSAQKYGDVDFITLDPNREILLVGAFDEAIYSINPDKGDVKWRIIEGPVSGITLDGSRIYFSTGEGNLISAEASSGKIIFSKSIFRGVGGQSLIYGNLLFATDSKGPLRVVDKNEGKLLEEFSIGGTISAPLTIDRTKGALFLMSDRGNLYRMRVMK